MFDDIDEPASKLNNDLIKIQEWAFQEWKVSFNDDRAKPVQDVIISLKPKNIIYRNLHFNKVSIVKTTSQKHLRLNLDVKLTFNDHIKKNIGKAKKGVSILHKLQVLYDVQVC